MDAPPSSDAPASLDDLVTSMRGSLANLPDACNVTTALPQLMNPRTPAMVMAVLDDDLARRPDPIKLRTLFLIAGSQSHPRGRCSAETAGRPVSEKASLIRGFHDTPDDY